MQPKNEQPILTLFDPESARAYLSERMPLFVKAHPLDGLAITPLKRIIKRTIGEGFHHVIIRYDAPSFGEYPLFCTAYSTGEIGGADQSRARAYAALTFLSRQGFKSPELFLPAPLFFDSELKALFYQGIEGENLRSVIEHKKDAINPLLEQTAHWITRLHAMPTNEAPEEIVKNSLIATTDPKPEFFKPVISERAPEMAEEIERLFARLASQEKESLGQLKTLCVVHGDLHPENVIFNRNANRVSVTDFTDVALGDWAKDIGGFLQQLAFMSLGWRTHEQIAEDGRVFLKAYLTSSGRTFDANAKERVALYYGWAALRSTIYFLTKKPFELAEAKTTMEIARQCADKEQQL